MRLLRLSTAGALFLAACSTAPAVNDVVSDATADVANDLGDAITQVDSRPDGPLFDEGPPFDARTVPQGLGVVLRPDGRIDVGIDGVPFDGTEFVVRFADGSERVLSSLSPVPAADASMALEGSDGALHVRVSLALRGADAVQVDWEVRSTQAVQGIELRTDRTALPDGAHVVMEGSQSWSFVGPYALAPGALQPRDATGAITYPALFGNVVEDAPARGWFRGDVVWPAGGVSVCAVSPLDRALVVSLERPTSRYVLRVTDGIFRDERVTPATSPLRGAFVLARADIARPFACQNAAPLTPPTRGDRPFPRGWWSWNTLFANVTTAQVLAHVAPLAAIDPGAHHITVDDGWENAWGDWTERPGFGGTIASLATQLSASHTTLGLWLAPFLVDPALPVVSAHPDWFVRDPSGAAVRVTPTIGVPYVVLDATHPEVLAYLTSLFQRLRADGVTLFKIDFLYAGSYPGLRHDPLVSGLVAYRRGLEAIAAGAGDAHINGCGALVLPSLPYVDSMRIGADNTFSGLAPFWGSVVATARNLATRAGLADVAVRPDPDQPVVRGFSDEEGRAFLAVGLLSGGGFGYGDDLTALTAAQRALLQEPWFIALRDAPIAGLTVRAVDLFDSVGTVYMQTPVIDGIGSRRTTTQARAPTVWTFDTASTRYVLLFNWMTTAADRGFDVAGFGASLMPREMVASAPVTSAGGRYVVTVPPHAVRVLSGARP